MFRTGPIGSPGIYIRQAESITALQSDRMDVCAFVGIAPRGPCREPRLPEWWREGEGSYMGAWQSGQFPTRRSVATTVESFDEYRRLYGGFEGPGRLPYAVAAYFENGGARAVIVRIVHAYKNSLLDQGAIATGVISGATLSNGEPLKLLARSEGIWGNQLRAGLGFLARPLIFIDADISGLVLEPHQQIPVGTLLRCFQPNARPELRFVSDSRLSIIHGERKRRIDFTIPLLEPATMMEVVEGELLIDDAALIREQYSGLGLSAAHPRWIAKELCYRSELVYPDSSWDNLDITIGDEHSIPIQGNLPELAQTQFTGGEDRYKDLEHDDFFDSSWSIDMVEDGDGVHAISTNTEVASVTVPDLYCPEPLPDIAEETELVSLAGPEFLPCINIAPIDAPAMELPDVNQLCLDPALPGDREKIVALQKRLVAFADVQSCWVALLDVPPGLQAQQMAAWRGNFNSSYAAAYFPWLRVSRGDDERNQYVEINPAAVAAGVIAKREIVHGVHFGPANELAKTIVSLRDPISEAEHDQLHPLGLNAFVVEPGGIRLTAARTLATDISYRQLNVRRLMILIKRVLIHQTQWVVFEPNGPSLWRQLSQLLENFLSQLYRAGAFIGATTSEAFFVRCDEETNTRQTQDAGQIVAEIGVAPVEPMEFIVLRLSLGGDSTLVREV